MAGFDRFLKQMAVLKGIIIAMSLRELKTRHAGSVWGSLWALLSPFASVATFWLVFSVGFRFRPDENYPFIIFFLCGWIPWFVFQEALTNSASAITRVPYLVKKILFPTEILPIVHILVSCVSLIALMALLCGILAHYSAPWSLASLQVLYYIFAMFAFALGVGWVVSSLNVFFRDVSPLLSAILGLWFWFTPIVWSSAMIPEAYRSWLFLNPMYYIVEGFRESLLYQVPLWDSANNHLLYWATCFFFLFFGGWLFRRLKPEFAEVL